MNNKDTCHSYNGQFGETKEVLLTKLVSILPDGEKRYKDIAIDACIAPVIKHLWNNDVNTLSSCCGHGNRPPSIVLGNTEEKYSHIRRLISEKDNRQFELSQWKRVLV